MEPISFDHARVATRLEQRNALERAYKRVIAAESHVKLGQPETSLGIIPGWSGTQRAVRRFGSSSVKRMALFGKTFTADEALQLGIVDRVVDKGQGLAEARTTICKLFLSAIFVHKLHLFHDVKYICLFIIL